jgi:hypothetical protein
MAIPNYAYLKGKHALGSFLFCFSD